MGYLGLTFVDMLHFHLTQEFFGQQQQHLLSIHPVVKWSSLLTKSQNFSGQRLSDKPGYRYYKKQILYGKMIY